MNKKEIVFVILGVLIIAGLIGVVSAADAAADFEKIFEEFRGVIQVFFEKILGMSSDSNMFFQRCLILLVVYGIVYTVLNRMELFASSPFLSFFVSFAIAILGVRWLDEGLIQNILLPYAALGGSIAIFLPFLIYFMFVHTSVRGVFGRRSAWILFGLIFVAIYITRGASGEMGGLASSYSYLYIFGFFAVIACFAFDPLIHQYFELGKTGKMISNFHKKEMREALVELRRLNQHRRNGIISEADFRTERRRLEHLIKTGGGQI